VTNDEKLDSSGCCKTLPRRAARHNPPNQSEVAYRLDTHSGFMRQMSAKLHLQRASDGTDNRPLEALATRSAEDPAIAILDAWATVADVLTFYQERIANEGFLRTATERRSVLELACSIGYELKPGAAAGTYLAFTVEEASGAPQVVKVPERTGVQSIPEPGKLPQRFETVEPILARREGNALRPRLTETQRVGDGSTKVLFKGVNTRLQPGDAILFVGPERENDVESQAWQIRILEKVMPDLEQATTLATWDEPLKNLGDPKKETFQNPKAFALREHATIFGSTLPDWRYMPFEVRDDYVKAVYGSNRRWSRREWPGLEIKIINGSRVIDLDATYPRVIRGSWVVLADSGSGPGGKIGLYRVRSASTTLRAEFMIRAKITRIVPDTHQDLVEFPVRGTEVFVQSEQLNLADVPITGVVGGESIELDRLVHGLEPGKVLTISGKRMRARVESEELELEYSGARKRLDQGEMLNVVEPAGKGRWTLGTEDGFVGSITPGNRIQLHPALEEDEVIGEAVTLSAISNQGGRTRLTFKEKTANQYDPATVVICANVARATHGETVREVLGSGDGTEANQRFTLKKPPLTYLRSPVAEGIMNTLDVRVNGVLWSEASSLHDLDEFSQSYIVRMDDENNTHIIFGDGKRGARLPTGVENVEAVYRSGIGPDGQVQAGSLSLLQIRPQGIRSVTNPTRASGGAPPESLSDARNNAFQSVQTLDRIVSLRDFENFAQSFPGIGKACATVIPVGGVQKVHITIAASDGSKVGRQSELFQSLLEAIDAARSPTKPVLVDSFRLLTFSMVASILIDSRYRFQDVRSQVEAILRSKFSFENRDFGQSISVANVLTLIQDVEGVIAADLDRFDLDPAAVDSLKTIDMALPQVSDLAEVRLKSKMKRSRPSRHRLGLIRRPHPDVSAEAKTVLRARLASLEDGKIKPAELLLLNPSAKGVVLKDMTV